MKDTIKEFLLTIVVAVLCVIVWNYLTKEVGAAGFKTEIGNFINSL